MEENNNQEPNTGEESFEKLLEDSYMRSDDFTPGDRVTGTVILITEENAFIDIQGKSEAVIEISEFKDKDGKISIKNGDSIDAFIVSRKSGEIQLTTCIGRGYSNSDLLNMAYTLKIPVEGTIINTVKGGYNVSVSGIICFCPFSQIDIKSPADPQSLINKKFVFLIIEASEKGKNIILSRRVLLEEQQEEKEKELKNRINPGDIIEGVITTIADFGIFVDIGGIEALIPKSEISWSRKQDLSNFNTGDIIKVLLLSADWKNKKFVLSIKQLSGEPWGRIDQYEIGQTINGKVINIIKSGAFVEIEPGLEGYIPVSKMSIIKRVRKPEDVLSLDDEVNIKIIEINKNEKKILLELVTNEPDPWLLPTDELINNIHDAVIEMSKPSGLNVRLANGMAGFLPVRELESAKSGDINKLYPVGKSIKVAIKDIISDEKRLILSELMALEKKEKDEFGKYINQVNENSSSGATFGNIFKDKFDELKKKIE